jgi:hypothetical protein
VNGAALTALITCHFAVIQPTRDCAENNSMPWETIRDWLVGSVAWELLFRLLALSYLADFVIWPLGKAFGLFKNKAQTTAALILVPLFLFLVLFSITTANQATPDIYGIPLRTVYGGHTIDNKIDNVALLTMSIVNKGSMPSAILSYKVKTKLNVSTYDGQINNVPSSVTMFGDENRSITAYADSMIYNKTTQPIPAGGGVSGSLFCQFPTIGYEEMHGAKPTFIVTINDVTGRQHDIEFVPGSDKYTPQMIPGLHEDIK